VDCSQDLEPYENLLLGISRRYEMHDTGSASCKAMWRLRIVLLENH
jgi:hypothetical protein